MAYSMSTDYGTFTLHRLKHDLVSGEYFTYEFIMDGTDTNMEPCEMPEGFHVTMRYEDGPPILLKD